MAVLMFSSCLVQDRVMAVIRSTLATACPLRGLLLLDLSSPPSVLSSLSGSEAIPEFYRYIGSGTLHILCTG